MEMLKKAMDTLTPMASVRDGMGLEDGMHSDKGKEKEPIPAHPAESHRESDAEGSAVGNFISLKPLDVSVNQDDQIPARSQGQASIDDRGAKSKKCKQAPYGKAPDGCGTSKRTHFCSICHGAGHMNTTHVHTGVIFLAKKGRRQNAQTAVLANTRRTPATNPKWCCMLLKMQLQNDMRFTTDLVTLRNL